MACQPGGSTPTNGSSDTGPTPTTIAECFASVGLDGICAEGELEWAVLGPQGCTAQQQTHTTGTISGQTLYYDVDGDITRMTLGAEPSPIRVQLESGARGLYADYPWFGLAEVSAVPWRDAFAEVHFELPADVSLSQVDNTQVAGRFWMSGGEIDLGPGFVAAPDATGEGCFDLLVSREGDFR